MQRWAPGFGPPLPLSPIAGPTAVMDDGQYSKVLASKGIGDGGREVLNDKPTATVKPYGTEHRVLKQQRHSVLELGEKSLRQRVTTALSIVFRRFPKVELSLGMQRVNH